MFSSDISRWGEKRSTKNKTFSGQVYGDDVEATYSYVQWILQHSDHSESAREYLQKWSQDGRYVVTLWIYFLIENWYYKAVLQEREAPSKSAAQSPPPPACLITLHTLAQTTCIAAQKIDLCI